MEITEAIRTRRSIRSYRPEPVPVEVLKEIIETCQWAGSFMNTQPWEFAVLGGEVMKEWKRCLVRQFEANELGEREIYPEMPLPEPYAQRAEAFRANIDNLMFPPGTENLEEKRHEYTISGIQVRDAPNAIAVATEKRFVNSTLPMIAVGIIVQSVCLAAMSYGLGTCVMGRPVENPRMLREMLGIPESKAIPCVIAIGYPDFMAPINSLVRQRAPLDSWVHWHGF
jgi:nitroreductase